MLEAEQSHEPTGPAPRGGVFCFGGPRMTDPIESLAALLRRYRDDADDPPDVPRVSLAEALRAGDDPLHVVPYLASLGLSVRSLDDLLLLNGDDTEEELHSFRVVEGVAVSQISDGLWLLFD